MDHSWLHDDSYIENSNSDSDNEAQTELENRLYSIVHHNDLSKPLAPELAKHYSVHCEGNGEVVVTLNDTLEDIKLEEYNNLGNLLENLESNQTDFKTKTVTSTSSHGHNGDSLVPVVKIPDQTSNHYRKRFRYSDLNIDDSNTFQIREEIQQEPVTQHINYFQINPNLFSNKKNKQLAKLVIPPDFLDETSKNWRNSANANYISIGESRSSNFYPIVRKMYNALLKVNPGVKRKVLFSCANLLYKKNVQAFKKNEIIKRKSAMNGSVGKSDISTDLPKQPQDDFRNSEVNVNLLNCNKNRPKLKSEDRISGSISLNISPFKPNPQVIDLVYENEKISQKKKDFAIRSDPIIVDLTSEERQNTSRKCEDSKPKRTKKLANSHVPDKWSKAMIKFYTSPSKELIDMDLGAVFKRMKKTTTSRDWKLDPRDQDGVYKRASPKGKHAGRRCPNCRERGHLAHDCPKPPKIPACILCGEWSHTDYSCPNKICLKCGVYLRSNVFTGECETCYFSTLESEVPCDICGEVSHRTTVCPDLWRSYHATTSGEKKIPSKVNQNKRKYCCNCTKSGHFSHDCPFLSYTGQKISPFVTNYSAQPLEKGSAEIVLSKQFSHFINNEDFDSFLQNLSNWTSANIEVNQREENFIFRISGTFEQCKKVKTEIEEFVNTKKRKRSSPFYNKKKQRLRY